MPRPLTADERERRVIEYLLSVHQGRISEFRLKRLNRVANFRKQLMDLMEAMIEERAEYLAAGMLLQYAPPRPKPKTVDVTEGRLPVGPKRARMPVWVRKSGAATAQKSK